MTTSIASATPSVKSTPSCTESKSTGKGMHRRSRNGCYTCRLRRKKCDETKPFCSSCGKLGIVCEYKRPMWWSNSELRTNQKEAIKEAIKRTKINERNLSASQSNTLHHVTACHTPPSLYHSPTEGMNRTRGSSMDSSYEGFDFNALPTTNVFQIPILQPMDVAFDPFQPTFSPTFHIEKSQTEMQSHFYLDDVERRRDSSIMTSTFNPNQSGTEWIQKDHYEFSHEIFSDTATDSNFDITSQVYFSPVEQVFPIENQHDSDLLTHFWANILPIVFPLRDVNNLLPSNYEMIVKALQTNPPFLHCCLATSALHLKSTVPEDQQDIYNADFERHTMNTIDQIVSLIQQDSQPGSDNEKQIIEAALAMIYMRNLVANSQDLQVTELPWTSHFKLVTEILDKSTSFVSNNLQAGAIIDPSTTISSWIDILGSTMSGNTPKFANLYREKNLRNESLGLSEITGCDDKILFLISEISCLEELKAEGRIDELQMSIHVNTLASHLNATEQLNELAPCQLVANGPIDAIQLGKIITHIFRIATRIYLSSVHPDFDPNASSIQVLVQQLSDALEFIPSSAHGGFDRSLVWPLLIAGGVANSASDLRMKISQRANNLGFSGEKLGSFARMFDVLIETWKTNDESFQTGQNPIHWRSIMEKNNWTYLLI